MEGYYLRGNLETSYGYYSPSRQEKVQWSNLGQFLFGTGKCQGTTLPLVLTAVLGVLLLPFTSAAEAQESVNEHFPKSTAGQSGYPEAGRRVVETPTSVVFQHRFWDRSNLLLFSGIAVSRGLDYASTRNMQSRGREEILIPDDVVNNSAGFASLEAAGGAVSIGISYLLHRSNHHKLERWLSIGHISVTGFGASRNYSLESRPRTFPSPRH